MEVVLGPLFFLHLASFSLAKPMADATCWSCCCDRSEQIRRLFGWRPGGLKLANTLAEDLLHLKRVLEYRFATSFR